MRVHVSSVARNLALRVHDKTNRVPATHDKRIAPPPDASLCDSQMQTTFARRTSTIALSVAAPPVFRSERPSTQQRWGPPWDA